MTSKIFSKFSNFFKKGMVYGVIFSLSFPHFAWATEAIIELDFQDSQTPQRLHVIPRLSNVADVSHVEIDTEQQQVVVHRLRKPEDDLAEQSAAVVSLLTSPVMIQKHDVQNLPWELEPEQLSLFILNHNAWLSPLGEDGYKLVFKGGLLGGMKKSERNIPTITVTKFTVDCQGRNDWPKGTIGEKFCNKNGNGSGNFGINVINKPYVPPVDDWQRKQQRINEELHNPKAVYASSYSPVNFPKGREDQAYFIEDAIERYSWDRVYQFADKMGFPREVIRDYLNNRKSDKEKLVSYLQAKKKRDKEEQVRKEQERAKIQKMTSPEEFDRHFIESTLLPTLQKFNSHPASKNYKTFITHPGTGYTPGMNLNDYWQSWLNNKTWGEAARKHSLPLYQRPVHLMKSPEEFDRDFIESTLLPTLQKFNSHPAYKNYKTFITHPGTGYTPGMNLNDYWQSWLSSKTWGEAAKKYSLPKYEVPDTCNPFYGEYDKLKRVQHLINTASWEAVYDYTDKEGISRKDVQYINTRRGEEITFDSYMKEVFDDQVLEEWGVKDWKEVALNELEMPEFMRVNWFKGGKAAWELIKTFTPKTQELLKRLNTYKEQLFARNNAPKGNTTLKAAEQELKSNQIDLAKQRGVTYNHVKKVEQAQEGLEKLIENINNRLGFPNLSDLERKALQEELAKASKLLDHTKQFVPRQK